LMLAMAEEPDDEFLRGKIVADFGCGPKGSLIWAASASQRIGIDVLAARYAEEFTSQMIAHGMIYVTCTERVIPLPSDFVDVLFTLNAIDHVDSFPAMCSEILRIIKPGGDFIGSFNLEEPPTPTEPQRLTEKSIKEYLLDALVVRSYRVASHAAGENRYGPLLTGSLSYERGKKGTLWVRAGKRPSTPLP
jgi:SAM-dependent methyltransferase